jgi:2-C-methyl-D-erythritol 4-phosphate cytidylyltransferase
MSRFAVILPAAGKSSRYQGPGRKKVFAELGGRPVWLRSVEAFVTRDDVVQTILVISPDDEEWFKEKFRANLAFLDLEIVLGGAERADSVQQALARVKADVEFVAVHDAARPLIAKEWITQVFRAAEQHGAAILGTPMTSTLKRVRDGQQIVETVPRDQLWSAQTPQAARRDWLLEAFAQRGAFQPTDEAQLLERAGRTVQMVPGSPINLKITTADDLKMAAALLDLVPKEKTLGPLHPFADEDARWP